MSIGARRLPTEAKRAFQPTADRSSLWLVGQYDDALRMLRAAVLGRQGLLLLVGEPGTGKTILARALTARVREEGVVVGRLPYPILEGMELFAAIAEAFDLPGGAGGRDGIPEEFRRFVAHTGAAGRRVLLIVDEAHSLTGELLFELARLPYGGETAAGASLSVLLVGQRGLLDTLHADGVEADVLSHLRPLTREQTAEYIAHRVRAAGYRGRLFTPSALQKIWVVSEGIPRAVNTLCVEALSQVRQSERRTVTASMIDRSRHPVREPLASASARVPPPSVPMRVPGRVPAPRQRWGLVATAGALALTLGAAWGVSRSERMPWLSARPEVSSPGPGSAGSDHSTGLSRPEVTELPARPAADGTDPGAVIDWLLKQRRGN